MGGGVGVGWFGILFVPMKYIGVVDGNNFFVSCERLFRPDLWGKPVLVLSSNDGCVVARSQEVKDMGIVMGVPLFQIKDMVKDKGIVTFSSNFTLYRDISHRVFSVVKELLPDKEQYSIDEAFFTLEASTVEDASRQLRAIKQEVEQRVGIPVSIGIAATKTQAKYASKLAKKNGGVAVLDATAWNELSPSIPVQSIWGVGGALQRRYKAAGLLSVADVMVCPLARIASLFGVVGSRLQAELLGRVAYPVLVSTKPAQSITSSRSFKNTTTECAVVKDAVAYHVRQVVSDVVKQQQVAGRLTVLLGTSRHSDYFMRGGTKTVDFFNSTADVMVVMMAAQKLVDELFESDVPFKKVGVVLSDLVSVQTVQPNLFAGLVAPKRATDTSHTRDCFVPRKDNADLVTTGDLTDCTGTCNDDAPGLVTDNITDLVMELNERFGIETVQLGKHTKVMDWQSKHEQVSPSYTTQWSQLAVVKA